MANTRLVVDYPPLKRHREELREYGRRRRRRLLIAIPAALSLIGAAAVWSAPLAVLLAAVAGFAILLMALPGSSSVDPGHLAGVEGEAAVLECLKKLPDDYLILNRVRLPD